MFCRAKISVLLALVGALSATGAALNPGQRNTAFQPGGGFSLTGPAVSRPAAAIVPTKRWAGANIRKITPGVSALVRVQLGGVTFARAADAVVTPGPVKPAGAGR